MSIVSKHGQRAVAGGGIATVYDTPGVSGTLWLVTLGGVVEELSGSIVAPNTSAIAVATPARAIGGSR